MAVSERFVGANIVDAGRLSPYWGEHAARYAFALPYVRNKRVLDIACGTGYGIGLLQTAATSVTGVDVDMDAARNARSECGSNAHVLLGDGTVLPFSDESFDTITSFETLEHLNERPRFLSELRRVLKLRGNLILSTPNAHYTMPENGKPSNPFHVFEYTPEELRTELGQFFTVEDLMGQTLDPSFMIPPFYDAQRRLPKSLSVQARLFLWKSFNKSPFAVRERISEMIWGKPFYPTEKDYRFSPATIQTAPVTVAVCRRG